MRDKRLRNADGTEINLHSRQSKVDSETRTSGILWRIIFTHCALGDGVP